MKVSSMVLGVVSSTEGRSSRVARWRALRRPERPELAFHGFWRSSNFEACPTLLTTDQFGTASSEQKRTQRVHGGT